MQQLFSDIHSKAAEEYGTWEERNKLGELCKHHDLLPGSMFWFTVQGGEPKLNMNSDRQQDRNECGGAGGGPMQGRCQADGRRATQK